MFTKLRLVWIVARRELRDQLRDWRVLMPMLILVLCFPFLMNEFARQTVDFLNQYNANLILDRLVPFSIMIIGFFPITVSLFVALEAFGGRKRERHDGAALEFPDRELAAIFRQTAGWCDHTLDGELPLDRSVHVADSPASGPHHPALHDDDAIVATDRRACVLDGKRRNRDLGAIDLGKGSQSPGLLHCYSCCNIDARRSRDAVLGKRAGVMAGDSRSDHHRAFVDPCRNRAFPS